MPVLKWIHVCCKISRREISMFCLQLVGIPYTRRKPKHIYCNLKKSEFKNWCNAKVPLVSQFVVVFKKKYPNLLCCDILCGKSLECHVWSIFFKALLLCSVACSRIVSQVSVWTFVTVLLGPCPFRCLIWASTVCSRAASLPWNMNMIEFKAYISMASLVGFADISGRRCRFCTLDYSCVRYRFEL